jgi:hypothetical protein
MRPKQRLSLLQVVWAIDVKERVSRLCRERHMHQAEPYSPYIDATNALLQRRTEDRCEADWPKRGNGVRLAERGRASKLRTRCVARRP